MPTLQKQSEKMTRGKGFCGEIRWEFTGEMTWACYCHCDDCRRNCSAPVAAWLGVPARNLKWIAAAPTAFASSKGVLRYFCANCGAPMGFAAEHYPGGMHLYAASLESPEDFKPTFHVNYQSKLPWLQMNDDLPKYEGTMLGRPQAEWDYEQ